LRVVTATFIVLENSRAKFLCGLRRVSELCFLIGDPSLKIH
jgi:hypothetical protein